MSVNFEYYKVFYYVAKHKNITHAANALNLTQPSISRTIQLLESEAKCSLFERTTRGVKLTPEGEILFDKIQSAYKTISAAEEELEYYKNMHAGTVRVSSILTAFSDFLTEVIMDFRNQYPNIYLQIERISPASVLSYLETRELDIALEFDHTLSVLEQPIVFDDNKLLYYRNDQTYKSQSDFTIRKIKDYYDIAIAGRKYSFLEKQEISISDLVKYPLILSKLDLNDYYLPLFQKYGLKGINTLIIGEASLRLQMARQNLGITFFPRKAVIEELENGMLVEVNTSEKLRKRQLMMIVSNNHKLSIAAQEFHNFLIKKFLTLDPVDY